MNSTATIPATERPWASIHADCKTSTNGVRKVLVWVEGEGTVLAPWTGPKS